MPAFKPFNEFSNQLRTIGFSPFGRKEKRLYARHLSPNILSCVGLRFLPISQVFEIQIGIINNRITELLLKGAIERTGPHFYRSLHDILDGKRYLKPSGRELEDPVRVNELLHAIQTALPQIESLADVNELSGKLASSINYFQQEYWASLALLGETQKLVKAVNSAFLIGYASPTELDNTREMINCWLEGKSDPALSSLVTADQIERARQSFPLLESLRELMQSCLKIDKEERKRRLHIVASARSSSPGEFVCDKPLTRIAAEVPYDLTPYFLSEPFAFRLLLGGETENAIETLRQFAEGIGKTDPLERTWKICALIHLSLSYTYIANLVEAQKACDEAESLAKTPWHSELLNRSRELLGLYCAE